MFNPKKPTVQLLGRWQPWHEGHTALFKKAFDKTGQVVILIRNMPVTKTILTPEDKWQNECNMH